MNVYLAEDTSLRAESAVVVAPDVTGVLRHTGYGARDAEIMVIGSADADAPQGVIIRGGHR